MNLFMQLSDVEDEDGTGASYIKVELKRADLDRPFSEFAAIFLEPAIMQMKHNHEEMERRREQT